MWDDIYAWALAQAGSLSGIERVYDGPPKQPPSEKKYAVVGDSEVGAGNYAQDTDEIDKLTAESGEIVLRLVSRSGDGELAPHRTTTKTWVDSLTATVNGDPTLGILRQGSVAYVSRVDVVQPQTSSGAEVGRVVTLAYQTRV